MRQRFRSRGEKTAAGCKASHSASSVAIGMTPAGAKKPQVFGQGLGNSLSVRGVVKKGIHRSWLDVLGDPIRIRLLEQLAAGEEVSAAELSERVNAGEAALRRHLETMVALGLAVERRGASDGLSPGRPAARYRLLPDVRERVARLLALLEAPLASRQ